MGKKVGQVYENITIKVNSNETKMTKPVSLFSRYYCNVHLLSVQSVQTPEQQSRKSYLLRCLRIGMWEGHAQEVRTAVTHWSISFDFLFVFHRSLHIAQNINKYSQGLTIDVINNFFILFIHFYDSFTVAPIPRQVSKYCNCMCSRVGGGGGVK